MVELVKVGVFMAPCVVMDIKKKEIPVLWVLFCGVFLFLVNFYTESITCPQMFFGGAIGGVFLLLGRLSNQAVGFGDGIVIMVLGICSGFAMCFGAVLTALVFAGLFGMVLMIWKKKGRSYAIPFTPFLGIGFFITLIFSMT